MILNMTSFRNTDRLIPGVLIALSFIPIVAGIFRVAELGRGAVITADNARFFAAPLLVGLHLVTSVAFCLLGAFQFAPGFRQRKPSWHRFAGRVLVPCGLIAALTGLWLAQIRPPASFIGALPASFDGSFLYIIRLLAGAAMALSLCLGLTAVLRLDFPSHRAWMIRGYALGLGAGTQVFTHLPWFLFPSIRGELARTLCMGAGWAINIAVAEWIISRDGRIQPTSDHEPSISQTG
ncbi:MAG: DUF2306 domain-containing protein [Opitutae bacterium]